MNEMTALKGGEYLIKSTSFKDVFCPELLDEDQRMMADACHEFLERNVFPNIEKIENMEEGVAEKLLEQSGELGLLGIEVPEVYGGLGMDFNTAVLICDIIGAAGSFSTTMGAHTGIGTLPIMYYGTEEQKQKYIPKLISGEWKASYCLTEPNAGSDANSGKTKAVLSEDGKHYHITGQKMWITNGGFADVFIVFARIENDKNLTAFIVEREFGGITMGEEEKKMGIKGSSTRQIFFNDCKVPTENMLSERNKGFKIAVNILNIGRIKLAAGTLGAGRKVLKEATEYAIERKQFETSISKFGAIRYKLSEMATRLYFSESATYRTGKLIEDKIADLKHQGLSMEEAKLKGVEEFAIECAIMKVHGSEMIDYVTDEGVQIYGGMGFSADAPMERAYRDARIARIYEGTNEINRLLLVGMTLKKGMKGEIELFNAAKAVGKEILGIPDLSALPPEGVLGKEMKALDNFKKTILMVAGKAAQKFDEKFITEQEIIMNIADMMIDVFTLESALLRTLLLVEKEGEEKHSIKVNMAKIGCYEASERIRKSAREAIMSFAEGDELRIMLLGVKRFTKLAPINIKILRRNVAKSLIANNGKY